MTPVSPMIYFYVVYLNCYVILRDLSLALLSDIHSMLPKCIYILYNYI